MRHQTMHGNQHLPRGVPLSRYALLNDNGERYGYTWYPATDADLFTYVLEDAPASCGCDACLGFSTVWDQHRWAGDSR